MTAKNAASALIALAGLSLTTLVVTASAPAQRPAAGVHRTRVELGQYLVSTMGCNDCHTPLKLGPKGPEPDMERMLTGHPEGLKMPPPPALPPGPWTSVSAVTNTAFAGAWGVSFAANLRPDKETGLGDWTEEQFIATMRTGKHQGKGRAILPPMPYFMLGNLVDDEIKAIFAYLQSLPPVKNRVPQPVDPPESAK
ncbi:MAG: c-type cytochrome [Vicinamibacterales bacterium]